MNSLEIKPLRILVCDLEPLLAIGLAAAMDQCTGVEILKSGRNAPTSLGPSADIVVTGYKTGLTLAADARRRPRVVVLTERNRGPDVRAALDAGVLGYMVLGCKLEELAQCIDAVAGGNCYVSLAASRNVAEGGACRPPVALATEGADTPVRKSLAHRLRNAVCAMKVRAEISIGRPNSASRTKGARSLVQASGFDEPLPSFEPAWRHSATPSSTSRVRVADALS